MNNKQVVLKTLPPFTDKISEIKNMHEYNAKDLDVVIPNYSLVEYSEVYDKIAKHNQIIPHQIQNRLNLDGNLQVIAM